VFLQHNKGRSSGFAIYEVQSHARPKKLVKFMACLRKSRDKSQTSLSYVRRIQLPNLDGGVGRYRDVVGSRMIGGPLPVARN
jgi:hypothetical protein